YRIRPRKDALRFDTPLQLFGLAQAQCKIRVLLFVRSRADVQERYLGARTYELGGRVQRACVALRAVERNQDAKRFRLCLADLTQNIHSGKRTAGKIMKCRAACVGEVSDAFSGKPDPAK